MPESQTTLSPCQNKVLEYFTLKKHGVPVMDNLEVTINFHPDRMTSDGLPILWVVARDGILKSQFETGTSNGGLTAFPGGDRWKWESSAFNGIYDNCDPIERPKYGALNYKNLGAGGSPRFGSSYFKMKSEIFNRTTFCYPESYFGPQDYGIADQVGNLIALADADERDLIDHYIEAHIHGRIIIQNDIEALVMDPSYKETAIETYANQLPFAVEWHSGFRLAASVMEEYPDYRGIGIVELGQRIARDGWITPQIIGQAVDAGAYDAQDLKKVWHYLARFGDLNLNAEQDAPSNGGKRLSLNASFHSRCG